MGDSPWTVVAVDRLIERTAQIAAHRVCFGVEHDATKGKLHGYCVVCGVPWPCDYAGTPPALRGVEDPEATVPEMVGMLARVLECAPGQAWESNIDRMAWLDTQIIPRVRALLAKMEGGRDA